MPYTQTQCTFGGRGCGRRILFVQLASGKRMPVDPDPDPDGTVAVYRDAAGTWVGRVLKDGERPDPYERLHVTHFATCTAKREADARARSAKLARAAGATVLDDHRSKRAGRGRR